MVPRVDEANWPKTFETLEVYLANRLGHHKIPLAYVIIDSQLVGEDSFTFDNKTLEMIYHAPHGTYIDGT